MDSKHDCKKFQILTATTDVLLYYLVMLKKSDATLFDA